tara:strand:- start:1332 stop:2030 length:699 start_codon:yes stop_codon:yes gene_type:complete
MNETSVIPFLSEEWILYNTITLVFVLFFIFIPRFFVKKTNQFKYASLLSLVILFEIVFIQCYYLHNGIWTIEESMPFHMCRLMWIGSFILLLTKSQIVFEFLLFIGMMGGLHSLLTPQLTHGSDPLLLFDYFFVHGGLIVAPLFCLFSLGMRPRKNAWYKTFFYLQIPILCVALIDFLSGGNYMYLAVKPIVDNPFLVGDWPYYIIGLEFATLLHAVLVYIPFYVKNHFLSA